MLSLSGVTAMIWLEGINDFSKNGNATRAKPCRTGMKEVVGAHPREESPASASIGATVADRARRDQRDARLRRAGRKRKALNEFIRTSGVFDGVIDFDAATLDPATGELKAEFVPESTTGGPGDKLHPNRAGYLAMGNAIDLDMVMGKKETRASAQKK